MPARSHLRALSCAALLPLLLAAVAGLGYDRFRCAFSGQITEMGCCPQDEAPVLPVANAASCCDHEVATVVRAPAEAPGSSVVALDAPAALPRALVAPLLEARSVPARRAEAAGPPLLSPLELKQSLLI